MPFENILLETKDGIATLTINRPKQLNALNGQTLIELLAAFGQIATADNVRGTILTGAGEKAFVAGADISEMSSLGAGDARAFAELGHRVCFAIEEIDKPVVAAVNGFALGGGCELALACDFIYAATNAKFGQPEVKLGIIPGFGGTQRLARRVGKAMAKELIYCGEPISAEQAHKIGLCNQVCEPAELLPRARETLLAIAKRGAAAIAQAKRAIHAGEGLPLAVACELERQMFATLFTTSDAREGMKAFLEKREAKFKGV